jgi:hypothetical protein
MRAALLCVVLLAFAPAVAVAQTATAPAPTATTGVPPATATAPAPAATATTPATTATQVEINVPAAGDDDSGPAPLVVGLVALLALAVLVGLAWGFLRLTAWEPSWLPRLRHSVGEAGYRLAGAWAQFRDWFSPRYR